MSETEFEAPQPKGISRRTVTKAMAWSVPTIALATAVPAYALSGGGPTLTILAGGKIPGGSCTDDAPFFWTKDYVFLFKIENLTDKEIFLYFRQTLTEFSPFISVYDEDGVTWGFDRAVLLTPNPPGDPVGSALPDNLSIPAGQTRYVLVSAGPEGNSNATTAFGQVYVAWGHTSGFGTDPDHDYDITTGTNGAGQPVVTSAGNGWVNASLPVAGLYMTTITGNDCFPPSEIG